MRALFPRINMIGIILCCFVLTCAANGQSEAAKTFKTNCAMCHAANGSGDTAPGKALKAKDLRSDEVQKQSDAALTEVIGKGKGKMPAFAAKIQPDDMKKIVAYVREFAKQK